MAVFQAALINELEKLRKKKKVVVAVVLSLLVIVVGQLLVMGVRLGFGIRGAGSADFSMLVLSVAINTLLPLFAALVAIDSFSGEFAQNTMRITLTRPVSRFKLFSAKVSAIGIFILANLTLLLVFSLLAGLVFDGDSMTLKGIFQGILSYAVSFIPLFVMALGIVLLANILKSGISVFFVSILCFILFKGLGMFFSQYSGILLTSYFDWYNLWLANSFPFMKILREFLLMLGYAILFFTGAYYLFDKKEF
ncbi:MAG TPA: ABC transporter permease subunit [Desulfitobacterium dehalogenans]|uniref:ABC transporter permease subunit n=1 Tax=Desulfitobacterium dehalogenans TaxID=36854 RepID=A0A7C7D6C7_9FIRM|nr:ABC transporter permease subunit [Desulfitobacterium dehalogenans]